MIHNTLFRISQDLTKAIPAKGGFIEGRFKFNGPQVLLLRISPMGIEIKTRYTNINRQSALKRLRQCKKNKNVRLLFTPLEDVSTGRLK